MKPQLILCLSSYLFFAMRAFQQLNVVHHRVLWIIPTSALMAICEMNVILGAIQAGWWSWVPVWIGGSAGVISAMEFHRRVRR